HGSYPLSLHDALPICRVLVGGHHDHGEVRIELAELLEDLDTVHPRHADVEEHQIGPVVLRDRQGIGARAGGLHRVSLRAEVLVEDLEHRRLVVYEQEASQTLRHGTLHRVGNDSTNSAPGPPLAMSRTLPPRASAMGWATHSPSPVPAGS